MQKNERQLKLISSHWLIENEIKKKKLEVQNQSLINMDQDDTFYYIAGYTSGGAPYGVTWEEMGLEPYEDIEE